MPLPEPLPELEALSLLVTVGETGSITAAARLHSITQPAASLRIRTLERVLGVKLLSREHSGSRLTAAGVATVEWAGSVLHEVRALLAGTEALRSEKAPTLRLAASLTVAEYLLPGWLLQLAGMMPDTAVSLEMGNSARVAEKVLDGSVEVGFIEGASLPPNLESQDICTDQLVVVVGAGHGWAAPDRQVSVSDVARARLILRERGSGTREVLDEALAAHGLRVAASMELASTTAIKAAAVAGPGAAVLSALAIDAEIRRGQLISVPVEGLRLERTIYAIWSPQHPLVGASAQLIGIARDASREQDA